MRASRRPAVTRARAAATSARPSKTTTSQCTTCGKKSCCAELTACASSAGCNTLGSCVSKCADDDDACSEACADAATQVSENEYNAFISCYNDSCEAACAGSDPTGGMSDGGTSNNAEPEGCLPTGVPAGYCTDAARPVGHECHDVTPPGDCVALPNVGDVFCCAK